MCALYAVISAHYWLSVSLSTNICNGGEYVVVIASRRRNHGFTGRSRRYWWSHVDYARRLPPRYNDVSRDIWFLLASFRPEYYARTMSVLELITLKHQAIFSPQVYFATSDVNNNCELGRRISSKFQEERQTVYLSRGCQSLCSDTMQWFCTTAFHQVQTSGHQWNNSF